MQQPYCFVVVFNDSSEEMYLYEDFNDEVSASIKAGLMPRRIVGLNDNNEVIAHYDFNFQIVLTERQQNVQKS